MSRVASPRLCPGVAPRWRSREQSLQKFVRFLGALGLNTNMPFPTFDCLHRIWELCKNINTNYQAFNNACYLSLKGGRFLPTVHLSSSSEEIKKDRYWKFQVESPLYLLADLYLMIQTSHIGTVAG